MSNAKALESFVEGDCVLFDDIERLDIVVEDKSTKVGTFFLIPLLEESLDIELTSEGRCILSN